MRCCTTGTIENENRRRTKSVTTRLHAPSGSDDLSESANGTRCLWRAQGTGTNCTTPGRPCAPKTLEPQGSRRVVPASASDSPHLFHLLWHRDCNWPKNESPGSAHIRRPSAEDPHTSVGALFGWGRGIACKVFAIDGQVRVQACRATTGKTSVDTTSRTQSVQGHIPPTSVLPPGTAGVVSTSFVDRRCAYMCFYKLLHFLPLVSRSASSSSFERFAEQTSQIFRNIGWKQNHLVPFSLKMRCKAGCTLSKSLCKAGRKPSNFKQPNSRAAKRVCSDVGHSLTWHCTLLCTHFE